MRNLATAVKIVSKMKNNKILFIPDCNLGSYVKKQVPDKDIKLLQGGCPVHAAVTLSELKAAKKKHPEALILVHPECRPEITESADYVGSTSGIMSYAIKIKRQRIYYRYGNEHYRAFAVCLSG